MSLADALSDAAKKPLIVKDCCELIDSEVKDKGGISGLVIKGNGTKLEATLHATPDQVDAILSLLRAQLGLPPPALRSP